METRLKTTNPEKKTFLKNLIEKTMTAPNVLHLLTWLPKCEQKYLREKF